MQKTELRERIVKLPEFEKRDVKVKSSQDEEETGWTVQKEKAICEVGKAETLAYVGKNYNLMQFREILLPILDSFDSEVDGHVVNYRGYCRMTVYPKEEGMENESGKYGLVAVNSVDLSSSIMVRFCVKYKGREFSIPSKIAGLKKQHTGKAVDVTKNYISMVGKVQQAWGSIIENFPKVNIVLDAEKESVDGNVVELGKLNEKVKLGKRMSKKMREEYEALTYEGKQFTLWDYFLKLIDTASEKELKSEVHRDKKIDNICQSIFEYALLMNI